MRPLCIVSSVVDGKAPRAYVLLRCGCAVSGSADLKAEDIVPEKTRSVSNLRKLERLTSLLLSCCALQQYVSYILEVVSSHNIDHSG